MSIKKYTNIDNINNNSENAGQFLQTEDLFIVSQNQIEDTDFGDCKYDVMEVSVYDINNNLLPQKNGNNVAYIKTGDINYLPSIVSLIEKSGAIDEIKEIAKQHLNKIEALLDGKHNKIYQDSLLKLARFSLLRSV